MQDGGRTGKKIKQHQIQMQFKFKRGTTEVQGISFKLSNDIFKGSSIDRKLSYNNLKRQLGVSEKKVQQQSRSQHKMPVKLDRSIQPGESLHVSKKQK